MSPVAPFQPLCSPRMPSWPLIPGRWSPTGLSRQGAEMATMLKLIEELWFLKRDLVSEGYDRALARLAAELPMTIHEAPSGAKVWTRSERHTSELHSQLHLLFP